MLWEFTNELTGDSLMVNCLYMNAYLEAWISSYCHNCSTITENWHKYKHLIFVWQTNNWRILKNASKMLPSPNRKKNSAPHGHTLTFLVVYSCDRPLHKFREWHFKAFWRSWSENVTIILMDSWGFASFTWPLHTTTLPWLLFFGSHFSGILRYKLSWPLWQIRLVKFNTRWKHMMEGLQVKLSRTGSI